MKQRTRNKDNDDLVKEYQEFSQALKRFIPLLKESDRFNTKQSHIRTVYLHLSQAVWILQDYSWLEGISTEKNDLFNPDQLGCAESTEDELMHEYVRRFNFIRDRAQEPKSRKVLRKRLYPLIQIDSSPAWSGYSDKEEFERNKQTFVEHIVKTFPEEVVELFIKAFGSAKIHLDSGEVKNMLMGSEVEVKRSQRFFVDKGVKGDAMTVIFEGPFTSNTIDSIEQLMRGYNDLIENYNWGYIQSKRRRQTIILYKERRRDLAQ